MSELRKKAMTRLAICAVALVASIIFSVLLLTGTFDGKTSDSSSAAASSSDAASSETTDTAGINDPTADSFTASSTEEAPAEETPAEPEVTPEPTPEATPVPQYDGLSVQPTTYYNEGEQPSYTTPGDSGMNLRAGPGTDYDKVTSVPAGTGVTALGTNEDGSWVVVNYDGKYGWLKTEFLS